MVNIFNPYKYLAGVKSLVIGLVFILASSFLMWACGGIQDGYVHFNYSDAPFWKVLYNNVVNWLVPALLLFVIGLVMTKSKIRLIDVLGTLAFAQVFILLAVIPMFFPTIKEMMLGMLDALLSGSMPEMPKIGALAIYGIWTTICMIMYYVWSYNAFATSCNLKGTKAIVVFVLFQLVYTFAGSLILF